MKSEKIILSRWFLVAMFLMALILPPYASKAFAPQNIGSIVAATLSNSFVRDLLSYSTVFQIITLLFFVGLIVWKNKFRKPFTLFVGVSYLVYAIVQNIAITESFGLSMVLSNIVLCILVSFVWIRDAWINKNSYTFQNFNKKNLWLVLVALFCFWWPMNFSGSLDFNPLYFFSGHVVQSIQFCPMTPIFLIVLIFCKPTISLPIYRMTAIAGSIIGFWNMMSFLNPSTVFVGVYHLPLFLISLYVLIDSFKLQKNNV